MRATIKRVVMLMMRTININRRGHKRSKKVLWRIVNDKVIKTCARALKFLSCVFRLGHKRKHHNCFPEGARVRVTCETKAAASLRGRARVRKTALTER